MNPPASEFVGQTHAVPHRKERRRWWRPLRAILRYGKPEPVELGLAVISLYIGIIYPVLYLGTATAWLLSTSLIWLGVLGLAGLVYRRGWLRYITHLLLFFVYLLMLVFYLSGTPNPALLVAGPPGMAVAFWIGLRNACIKAQRQAKLETPLAALHLVAELQRQPEALAERIEAHNES